MARIPSRTTAAQRFARASSRMKPSKPTRDAHAPLLVMQYDGNIDCMDGLRRGFNGKPPRDRVIPLSDTIVTRADKTQYVIARNTRKYAGRKTTRNVSVDTKAIAREMLLQSLPSIHA